MSRIPAGSEVEASPVDGPGFRMEKAGPKAASQVFIFATGSGITPIKALIESGALQVSGAIGGGFKSHVFLSSCFTATFG